MKQLKWAILILTVGIGMAAEKKNKLVTWSLQYQKYPVEFRQKDYYVVDLFGVPDSDLKRLTDAGVKPVAYFSSQFESWRPDAKKFKKEDLGNNLDGWAGERWVNTKSKNVREIMIARIALAKKRGFVAIDVDNVDFYGYLTGFTSKEGRKGDAKKDAIEYVRFFADEAHKIGLGFSLKNAIEIIPAVEDVCDFFQNEQAIQYNEIEAYKEVAKKGKPVFNIEYKRPSQKQLVPYVYTIVKHVQKMGREEEVMSK